MNQVKLEGVSGTFSKFDWQPQVEVSTQLKNLADKHDLVMMSPYQIDATGEARFAKGILDAADIALIMKVHPKEAKCMGMETTKIRGGSDQVFTSGMNWDTLRMNPVPVDPPKAKEKEKHKKEPAEAKPDKEGNIPW